MQEFKKGQFVKCYTGERGNLYGWVAEIDKNGGRLFVNITSKLGEFREIDSHCSYFENVTLADEPMSKEPKFKEWATFICKQLPVIRAVRLWRNDGQAEINIFDEWQPANMYFIGAPQSYAREQLIPDEAYKPGQFIRMDGGDSFGWVHSSAGGDRYFIAFKRSDLDCNNPDEYLEIRHFDQMEPVNEDDLNWYLDNTETKAEQPAGVHNNFIKEPLECVHLIDPYNPCFSTTKG